MNGEQERILRALGLRISEIRRQRGLTQEQLAAAAKIDVQAVQRAETARSALSYARLALVSGALGVRMAELFGDIEATPPSTNEIEVQVLATWRSIPSERRKRALGILELLARD